MNNLEIGALIALSALSGYILMHFIFRYGKRWQDARDARKKGR